MPKDPSLPVEEELATSLTRARGPEVLFEGAAVDQVHPRERMSSASVPRSGVQTRTGASALLMSNGSPLSESGNVQTF